MCLVKESASEEEIKQFFVWVEESFNPTTDEQRDALKILSTYYANTDMPLCGMKSWVKRDYERFCKGYKATVERYRIRLYGDPNPPKPVEREVDWNNCIDNPAYRGPNGTWSLD